MTMPRREEAPAVFCFTTDWLCRKVGTQVNIRQQAARLIVEFPLGTGASKYEMNTRNTDISSFRAALRWGKRQQLEWRLQRARGEDVKRANSELNWREFWHSRTHLSSYPRHVQVGTNWTCNLKCNFCRLTLDTTQQTLKQLPKNELEISPVVLDAVLEVLPRTEMLTLTPLGEPLLYSKVGRVLERHRELGSNNLAMTTNANLINDDRARMIVEGGVNHLFVSIDSDDPEVYASMRVLGQLEKVEAALERINVWKRKLKRDRPTMTLASTFMERNVRQMPSLVDFAKRHSFTNYSVQLMEMENPELEAEFLGNHLDITREMLLETQRRAEETGMEVRFHLALRNLLTSKLSLPELSKIDQMTDGAAENLGLDAYTEGRDVGCESKKIRALSTRGKHLTEKCHYPWYFLCIDTDGDCRPCCWAGSSYGNLNNKSFDEVWNGEHAVQMRRDFLNNHIPKGCQDKHCRVDLDHTGTLG